MYLCTAAVEDVTRTQRHPVLSTQRGKEAWNASTFGSKYIFNEAVHQDKEIRTNKSRKRSQRAAETCQYLGGNPAPPPTPPVHIKISCFSPGWQPIKRLVITDASHKNLMMRKSKELTSGETAASLVWRVCEESHLSCASGRCLHTGGVLKPFLPGVQSCPVHLRHHAFDFFVSVDYLVCYRRLVKIHVNDLIRKMFTDRNVQYFLSPLEKYSVKKKQEEVWMSSWFTEDRKDITKDTKRHKKTHLTRI